MGGGIIFLSPLNATTIFLILCVIFVNGLTDAPNSVATCISTRCLKLKTALIFSAIFNFLGVFIMCRINSSVLNTVINMADFGTDSKKAAIALSASLFSIVLWTVIAWYFGIPTSESHSLTASLSGSAIALSGSFGVIDTSQWLKTIYGLFTSCGLGFLGGFLICKSVIMIFKNIKRGTGNVLFKYFQIFAAFFMSFMHGAQDGQKFIAVLILSLNKQSAQSTPTPIILLCSLIMALGTLTGGKKIIKSVGMDMLKTQKHQGFSADFAAAVSLLISTILGFPVSTTHAKTTAVMATGFAVNRKNLNFSVIKEIALTWLLTFPCCAILGFIMTRIFFKIF